MIAMRKGLSAAVLSILLLSVAACTGSDSSKPTDAGPALIEFRGRTMGTSYMVKAVPLEKEKSTGSEQEQAAADLQNEIDRLLKTINLYMSTYIEESEISRFNRHTGSGWFDVSSKTAVVFYESLRVSEISGGAFDVTVGPLINLWGFGPAKRKDEIPSKEEINNVKALIGYEKLAVRLKPPALKKEIPGIYCDLSAIAKGFGVDEVARHLESRGFFNYMVEIGGEVRTGGTKPGDKPWRVAIAAPNGSSSFQKVVNLKGIAMATSGDYHNYFEKDGVRYSHTIDPNTGKPITHNLASVTVLHKSCMTADALATAIDVMGPEKGYVLALKQNLAVFMILREKETFVEKMTPGFRKMLGR
jgi:thiamine biosynthesis lipoprotein